MLSFLSKLFVVSPILILFGMAIGGAIIIHNKAKDCRTSGGQYILSYTENGKEYICYNKGFGI